MSNNSRVDIIRKMIEQIELPEHAMQKAIERYEDIGEWLGREESIVAEFEPHIFPQGSFRLGTAVRPLDASDEYDIDLSCKLCSGITKENMSQKDFKELVGEELEKYRIARGIRNKLDAKRRCWRLEYQDEISFHIDIVPCLPTDELTRETYMTALHSSGMEELIALEAANTTVYITDNQKLNYEIISDDWHISNPEGYAKWFEYKMQPEKMIALLEKAKVDDVPLFRRKNPLQIVIQLLKRHRDNWSCSLSDSKPISIIITTLAAHAYNGESDIISALKNIVNNMERFIRTSIPRVPNPVDPKEDFADKWYDKDCKHLNLEKNFYQWLLSAKKDFNQILSSDSVLLLSDTLNKRFEIKVKDDDLLKVVGISNASSVISKPVYAIKNEEVSRPWCKGKLL